ncbi:MAG: hypothetical protein E7774_11900 [Bradyrhizobium sp.]|nr:MAG: hypothetical protein E7774_11900 [Bradyrhizobium sp.]
MPKPDAHGPTDPIRHQTPRPSAHRASAERKLRILERLTAGVSVAHIARIEKITIRRVRQIVAEMLERREVDPPAGFVQLQIARLSDAMSVAHTMMMEGDLQAMDRVVKIVGELDRYHGFGRTPVAAEPAPAERLSPPRLPAPSQAPLSQALSPAQPAREEIEEEIFLPAKP